LANYYDVGDRSRAAWSHNCAWPEAGRVRDYATFEPARIDVFLDGRRLLLDPGQATIVQGSDCGLNPAEAIHHYGA
jgi:hypothetical protein